VVSFGVDGAGATLVGALGAGEAGGASSLLQPLISAAPRPTVEARTRPFNPNFIVASLLQVMEETD
jgi:hypothetical protein